MGDAFQHDPGAGQAVGHAQARFQSPPALDSAAGQPHTLFAEIDHAQFAVVVAAAGAPQPSFDKHGAARPQFGHASFYIGQILGMDEVGQGAVQQLGALPLQDPGGGLVAFDDPPLPVEQEEADTGSARPSQNEIFEIVLSQRLPLLHCDQFGTKSRRLVYHKRTG